MGLKGSNRLQLRLEHNGETLYEVLASEVAQEITIGRSAECTWSIPATDRSASNRHAVIRRQRGSLYVVDTQSRNGIYFKGAKVPEHKLAAGDQIGIGDCRLYVEKLEKQAGGPLREFNRLEQLNGEKKGALYDLEKPLVRLGSASDCEIVLNDSVISHFHASIEQRPDGSSWIRDLGSRNGTQVNGAPLTGGANDSGRLLKDGDVQLAIVQNDIAYYAVNGTNMFDKKVDGIQAIASLYPETCQFVTLESSDVRSIADLKGKKVAVGAAGSGVEANVRQILQAYGLTYDDIDEQFLSFAESAAALKDGAIDVACLTAGYPTSSVNDVANQKQIRLIPLTNDRVEQLISEYPFFTKTVIPAGTYKGVDEDIQTVSVMAVLVAGDKLSEDTGYAVTKALFENLDKLSAAHSAAKNIKKDTATSGLDFMQLNKGAEKFYKE